MLRNKKFGFTLGELLVVLGIIGILTALAVTTVKPAEKKAVKYLYMNAYNSLSKAYYNAILKGYNPFTEEEFDGIAPEHSDTSDSGAEILCRGLTYWINTDTNKKTAEQDYSESCSSTKLTSELADEFLDENVQFTATNGMKFYISKMLGDNYKFYLVFVDTNGTRKPNSAEYTFKHGKTADDYDESKIDEKEKKARELIEPDIFAFAMLDTGRVCPIGIPEYDTNIMTARFGYFDDEGEPLYTKKSLAYYQAKGAAWGYYSTPGMSSLSYNSDEVFSMNDFIRSKIDSESKIVKDFPNLSALTPTLVSSDPPYNCSSEDLESCFVFLDEYRQ